MRCLQCDTEVHRFPSAKPSRVHAGSEADHCTNCGSNELVYDATDHPSIAPLTLDDFADLPPEFDEFDPREFDALGVEDRPQGGRARRSTPRSSSPYNAERETRRHRRAAPRPVDLGGLINSLFARPAPPRPRPRTDEPAAGGAPLLFVALALVALVSAVAMLWQLF